MNFRDKFWQVLSEIEISNDMSSDERREKLNKVAEVIRPHLPKSVFKYRVCNKDNRDALARNVIYAPPASYMNDPFDSLVYVDREYIIDGAKYGLSRQFIDDVRARKSLPDSVARLLPEDVAHSILEELLKLSEEEIDKRVSENTAYLQDVIFNVDVYIRKCIKDVQNISFITSFAATPDDPSMWNRYAGEGEGFVLEYPVDDTRFDFCRMCPNANTDKCDKSIVEANWYPIVYRDERFDATSHIDNYIGKQVLSLLNPDHQSNYIPDILFYDKCCLVKGKTWERENEWRLVCYPKWQITEIKPIAIHASAPTAIYYGPEIKEEDFRLLHTIIEGLRSKGATIKEYQMYLDPYSRDFNLKCKEI